MPCCFDALSARLIEQAGFALTFMSGFAVAATRIAQPDTGLMSYGELPFPELQRVLGFAAYDSEQRRYAV